MRDPDTYEPKGVALLPGAISTMGRRNPSVRLFYLDPDTYEVMDYDHYFFDLDANFGEHAL